MCKTWYSKKQVEKRKMMSMYTFVESALWASTEQRLEFDPPPTRTRKRTHWVTGTMISWKFRKKHRLKKVSPNKPSLENAKLVGQHWVTLKPQVSRKILISFIPITNRGAAACRPHSTRSLSGPWGDWGCGPKGSWHMPRTHQNPPSLGCPCGSLTGPPDGRKSTELAKKRVVKP